MKSPLTELKDYADSIYEMGFTYDPGEVISKLLTLISKLPSASLPSSSVTGEEELNLPANNTAKKSVGQILKEAIELHELNPAVVEKELDFPKGVLSKVLNDEFYTNSVPVVLFKNLLISLHIPFATIEPSMIPTFKLVLSKETPTSIKKKPHGYILWENEESVLKYTNHLKEIMTCQSTSSLPVTGDKGKQYWRGRYDAIPNERGWRRFGTGDHVDALIEEMISAIPPVTGESEAIGERTLIACPHCQISPVMCKCCGETL